MKGLVPPEQERTVKMDTPTCNTPNEGRELLTPAEVKARLKISTSTYTRLVSSGRMPFKRIGSMKRFVWADVLAALPKGPEQRATVVPRGALDLTAMLKKRAAEYGRSR